PLPPPTRKSIVPIHLLTNRTAPSSPHDQPHQGQWQLSGTETPTGRRLSRPPTSSRRPTGHTS
ncbi:MAG: hypothetical protein ACRDTG_04125, partial [Pseudonocardiaceae bacterium]